MCAIVGSRNIYKLRELVALNSYRGSHSFSLSVFNTYTGILSIYKKKLGTIDLSDFNIAPNEYAIAHVQAPTTDGRTADFIHPAVHNVESDTDYMPDFALWHNGIIKANQVKDNVEKYYSSWDTMQILRSIVANKNFTSLNDFDGTFSCLFYSREDLGLYVFRNEISPMFVDKDLNISSTKFENSIETAPNEVIKLSLSNNKLTPMYEFETVENPYYFGD